ncbi:hypothetical protein GCM10007276_11260 [Agaricicola taiwanensis]|uniref:DUF3096 domain-containing protein n=1 Tax=Agaricicola taiwanensis TaxID=591372 RepID=A0A8J2VL83_9RHOB|nr:hypothetical protein GCM10007276_11260 [Agaricicola taiwanensis]
MRSSANRFISSGYRRPYLVTLDIIAIQPIVALIAGILILIMPRLLNYIVAFYLIVIGIIGLTA